MPVTSAAAVLDVVASITPTSKQFGGALASGSTHPDAGYGITLDPAGDVFVAGEVIGDFGTPNPNRDHRDWFVMKLRPADGSVY